MIIFAKIAASLLLGVLAGFAAIYIFNKMPAAWLCDYDEQPPQELTDPYVQRVKGFPWRWIYAAGFSCLLVRFLFMDASLMTAVQVAAAGLFACWALLIIGLADLKYMIIPDQFVIMLALSAFGFIPFYGSVWQPILGALVGGGVMLAVSGLGAMIFHKEVLGFGDVKLMAALGFVLGLRGAVAVVIGASLLSGIFAAIGLLRKTLKEDDVQPFGPYLCGCGAIYLIITCGTMAPL